MRKDFTLYPLDEAVSVRTYIHETGKADEFQKKGVKLLQAFLSSIVEPSQKLISGFKAFQKAMSEPQHLGVQKTNNADVTSTMRNIMREIYGSKRIESIDSRMKEVEEHMAALDKVIASIASEDVSQSISNLGKSKRQLKREEPKKVEKPAAPASGPLPPEGSNEWKSWVAKRAAHLKGDDNPSREHLQDAHDELTRYAGHLQSGGHPDHFTWRKNNEWTDYMEEAINEYIELKIKEDETFFKSIMPPRPKYMRSQ